MKAALLQGLENKFLDTRTFATVCTDGASVMTGEQNGLAGLLRRVFPQFSPSIASDIQALTPKIHCTLSANQKRFPASRGFSGPLPWVEIGYIGHAPRLSGWTSRDIPSTRRNTTFHSKPMQMASYVSQFGKISM